MQRHPSRARGHRASTFSRRPLEALEPRRLLSGTLTITGTADADAITVAANSSGGIHLILNNVATDYAAGAYSALQVDSGDGADTINVQGTVIQTTINTTAAATVTVAASTGGAQGITQPLTIFNGSVTIDDSSDPSPRQVNVSLLGMIESIDGLAPATIFASGVATSGPGLALKLPAVGGSEVQVNGCLAGLAIESLSSSAADNVQIGNGSLGGVQFPLYIGNWAGSDDVTVDESSVSLGTITFNPAQQSVDGPGLQIGTSSGRIIVNDVGDGGTITWQGGDTFLVNDLSSFPTGTLNLEPRAAGGDISIWKTPAGSTINVTGRGGLLDVQANRAGAGNLAAGALNVSNDAGNLRLAAGDYLDATPRHVTLDTFVPDGTSQVWERLTGILTGPITYDGAGAAATLNAGHGGNTWDVLNTPPRPGPGPVNLTLVCESTDSVNLSGTGANTNLQINQLTNIWTTSPSVDTVDFGASHISDGTIINISGQNDAALAVRGASAADSFTAPSSGVSGMIQHGTERILWSGITLLLCHTGTFHNIVALSLELDGQDTTLLLDSPPATFSPRLTLNGGRAVVSGTHHLIGLASLSISNGGQLDITGNNLTIAYPAGTDPVTTTVAYVRGGYYNGAWNGSGIISSTLGASYGLRVASQLTNSAFVEPARIGDLNGDGRIDFTDLLQLAQNYGQTNASWAQGDFDYDRTVGFSDLLKLAQNYGALGSVGAAAAIPATSFADPVGSRAHKLHRISRKTVR